jgi:hypothetical protein
MKIALRMLLTMLRRRKSVADHERIPLANLERENLAQKRWKTVEKVWISVKKVWT